MTINMLLINSFLVLYMHIYLERFKDDIYVQHIENFFLLITKTHAMKDIFFEILIYLFLNLCLCLYMDVCRRVWSYRICELPSVDSSK